MLSRLFNKGAMVVMVALAAATVIGSLAACGGGATTTPTPTATQTATPTQTSTPSAAATSTAGGSASPAATIPITKVASPVALNGAGATFPAPLYTKWFDVYKTSVDPNVTVNYQAIGSGAGIQQITQKTVDFGASDAFLTDQQLAAAPGVLEIPTVAGAVTVAYNVPGVATGLKLTPDAIAGIFLGTITKWNDPAIASQNPGVNLPATDIAVVHRSDGSGTTNIFTNYLSAISPEWKSSVGAGTSVSWPVGLGAKGNAGVAGQIQQLPGGIGYVELAYAVQNKMTYASVQNKAGNFIAPSIDSTKAAVAASAGNIPSDLRAMIVNADGADSYPICGFTWILLYKDQTDQLKGQALTNFLAWAIQDGDQYASDLLYVPLPQNVKQLALNVVKSVTYNGQPIISGQ